jgi:hypothetical protein
MAKLTIIKGGILVYSYNVSPDCGFRFHTLAEVGEPYQAEFREMIEKRGLDIEYGADLDHSPWVVDRIKNHNNLA